VAAVPVAAPDFRIGDRAKKRKCFRRCGKPSGVFQFGVSLIGNRNCELQNSIAMVERSAAVVVGMLQLQSIWQVDISCCERTAGTVAVYNLLYGRYLTGTGILCFPPAFLIDTKETSQKFIRARCQ